MIVLIGRALFQVTTFTHYIDTDTNKPDDIYYHPMNTIVRAFDPGVDIPEWQNAGGVYTTAGDVVIYPSYLEQSTPKMTGPGTRITITCTFNLEAIRMIKVEALVLKNLLWMRGMFMETTHFSREYFQDTENKTLFDVA